MFSVKIRKISSNPKTQYSHNETLRQKLPLTETRGSKLLSRLLLERLQVALLPWLRIDTATKRAILSPVCKDEE